MGLYYVRTCTALLCIKEKKKKMQYSNYIVQSKTHLVVIDMSNTLSLLYLCGVFCYFNSNVQISDLVVNYNFATMILRLFLLLVRYTFFILVLLMGS